MKASRLVSIVLAALVAGAFPAAGDTAGAAAGPTVDAAAGAFVPAPGTPPPADLTIGVADCRIEQRADGGYHLFIRKKPGAGSVLLTETTKDPAKKADNFAYRSPVWNPVNGDEKRLLNGALLPPEKKLWSLIDSTPEPDRAFGEAFHLFIPYVVTYGYPWSRSGEVQVLDGTFLNIRVFSLPYGDYAGPFADNPFTVRVVQKPAEGPVKGNYSRDTVETFTEIAKAGSGDVLYAAGPDDISAKIGRILDKAAGNDADIVLCVDTTASMQDDIDSVRRMVPGLLETKVAEFTGYRIGLVLYKDYFEEYLTKDYPFTASIPKVSSILDGVRVGGGRDTPEAVYEALYAAVKDYPWSAGKRLVILIGDAPPHPKPRGSVTKEMVYAAAGEQGIELNVIILPN